MGADSDAKGATAVTGARIVVVFTLFTKGYKLHFIEVPELHSPRILLLSTYAAEPIVGKSIELSYLLFSESINADMTMDDFHLHNVVLAPTNQSIVPHTNEVERDETPPKLVLPLNKKDNCCPSLENCTLVRVGGCNTDALLTT